MKSVYLDYNATTPLDPRVQAAMEVVYGRIFGNPSSLHSFGRSARVTLDDSRRRVAELLGATPAELVFTGSGTESNNLAIVGSARALRGRRHHCVTSAIEHPSVLRCFEALEESEGCSVTYVRVGRTGCVTTEDVAAAVQDDTALVSIMAANNETGAVQPVAEIGAFCRERGILFHTDASQWIGKQPLGSLGEFNADLVSICAHKIYGPKGVGLLYAKAGTKLKPVVHGGEQEEGRRSGTENLAAIVGFATALELTVPRPVFDPGIVKPLTISIAKAVASVPGVQVVSATTNRLANTVAFTVKGCPNDALIAALDLKGFCVSGGAACSTGALVPSHVLLAMGCSADEARSFIRVSVGRETSFQDVEAFIRVLPDVVGRVRDANIC